MYNLAMRCTLHLKTASESGKTVLTAKSQSESHFLRSGFFVVLIKSMSVLVIP